MDKQEFENQKRDIETRLGKPVFENYEAMNDSAKEMLKLRAMYMQSCRKENQLRKAYQESDVERLGKALQLPPASLTEDDILEFDPWAKVAIQWKFEHRNARDKETAKAAGVSTSKVAALWRSVAYRRLLARVYDSLLPELALESIERALRSDDTKVTLRVAEHYKILSSEKQDVTIRAKEVEDPAVRQALKALGDQLA